MDALKAYESESENSNSADFEDVSETIDEAGSENTDFFGIFSKKSGGKGSDDSKLVAKEADDSKTGQDDFLGILHEDKRKAENSEEDRQKLEAVVKKSVMIDSEEVTIEIPSSSFWNDLPVDDIQVYQHTDKKNAKHLDKRPDIGVGQKRTVNSYGYQTCLKKTKVSKEFEAGLSKEKEQCGELNSNQKRKLYFVHFKITPLLHNKRVNCKFPTTKEWDNPGHAGAVNRLKWNIPNYSHLLVTCSMDSTIKVWNIWSQLDPCVQMLKVHSKAVRDVAWNQDGRHLLSSSYDKSAVVSDVERGAVLSKFEHSSFVTCCKYHPVNQQMCVTGANNQLVVWDIRTPSAPCRSLRYKDNFGQVQDVVLTEDGSTLFSCSDLVSRDSADRNLMAWDFHAGIVLSNQVYQERFTLTRLQVHPTENQLMAQSNGNYIALFSLQRPYKMNKHKRFESHKLHGYNIGFDNSPDGQTVYSGSADGKIYCYNYHSGKQVKCINTGMQVAMDIACHPLLPSTVAVSSWDGTVQVWK